MPKKKSVALASKRFIELAEKLDEYYVAVSEGTDLTNQEVTWTCEAAIIKLNAYFEHLMLNAWEGGTSTSGEGTDSSRSCRRTFRRPTIWFASWAGRSIRTP
jgi:hypothetical protein